MNKKINRLKVQTLIITLLELFIVGIFLTLYLLDVGNMDEYIRVEYIALGFFIIIFLDCLFIFKMLFSVYKIRKDSDVKVDKLLGNDIEEAYLFSKMGIVVIDKEGLVLWESDYLYEKGIDIVNLNIFEWNEKFEAFIKEENDYKLIININNDVYNVKYLRTAGIFIFLDVSEYEALDKYSREQATCIGVITIDNYQDIAGNNDDTNDVIAKVKNVILEYGKEYNLLLRYFKSDSYLVICNFKSLERMKADRFSILDKAKNVDENEHIQPTLSIGFAHDFPDVNKLNEMASNAIEIAMSRGGDQAVVSKYGSELEFYGGKSDAMQKRNRVHVRMMADSMIDVIEKSGNIFIMGHTDMDMDALGAALGIYSICISKGKQAYVVYEPKQTEKKTRSALTTSFSKDNLQKIVISSKEALEKTKPSTLVIVVDVSRPKLTMCPELLEKTKKVIVIDHHRRAGDDVIENPVLSYIEPASSSTCELIAEMLRYSYKTNDVKIDPSVATIMLSGIFLDTGFFKNKSTGLRTFEASMILKDYGADNGLADDFLKDEYEEYIFINKILSTMKTPYYGVVYCVVEDDEIVERTVLAKVANQCMALKGINAAFVIGKTESNEVRISARSDGTVNVQILCEKLGGGGHFQSAATLFKNTTVANVENELLNVLDLYLSEARTNVKTKGD